MSDYYDRLNELFQNGKRLRAPGHKLSFQWSGEYGVESSSTAECICGWQEPCSSQHVGRHEYRYHLASVIARKEFPS